MKRLLYICLLHILLAVTAHGQQQAGAYVFHLGDAPLLGFCPTKQILQEKVALNQADIREAVRQAGHSPAVADKLIEAIALGQVVEQTYPKGTQFATMGWKGSAWVTGIWGVHTLDNPTMGIQLEGWEVRVTIDQKIIIWVLPKACGNLARLGVSTRVTIRTEIPRPPVCIPPPTTALCYAPGAKQRGNDTGRYNYKGATQSSGELRLYPKSGDTNVCVSGVSSAVANSKSGSTSSSTSTTGPIAISNQVSNINQNNIPVSVNVVSNNGPGNASGTSTATGSQNAGANQGNIP